MTVTAFDVSGVGFLSFVLAEAIGYATGTGPAIAQIVQGVLCVLCKSSRYARTC